jgi:hypothetical protein
MRIHKPIPVCGKGDNVRDWVYVEDHARSTILTEGRVGECYKQTANRRDHIEIGQLGVTADMVSRGVQPSSRLILVISVSRDLRHLVITTPADPRQRSPQDGLMVS